MLLAATVLRARAREKKMSGSFELERLRLRIEYQTKYIELMQREKAALQQIIEPCPPAPFGNDGGVQRESVAPMPSINDDTQGAPDATVTPPLVRKRPFQPHTPVLSEPLLDGEGGEATSNAPSAPKKPRHRVLASSSDEDVFCLSVKNAREGEEVMMSEEDEPNSDDEGLATNDRVLFTHDLFKRMTHNCNWTQTKSSRVYVNMHAYIAECERQELDEFDRASLRKVCMTLCVNSGQPASDRRKKAFETYVTIYMNVLGQWR